MSSSIFDEIVIAYNKTAQDVSTMSPGQTSVGSDGQTYVVVEDPTKKTKALVPQNQMQDPNDPNPPVVTQPQMAQQPMGAETTARKFAGVSAQDWADLSSMGEDIKQYATKKNMKGIVEITEDLTNFVLAFVDFPEEA